MNPLFQNNNSSNTIPNNSIQTIKNMMNNFNFQNPQQAIQQLASQNPQIQQILQMQQQSGMSFENLFKSMCQQQGVDPNSIINQLR